MKLIIKPVMLLENVHFTNQKVVFDYANKMKIEFRLTVIAKRNHW